MKDAHWLGRDELNRREFLRLAVLTSVALAESGVALGAAEEHLNVHFFGQLQQLPPGAVQPKGWLRNYLEKQAAELGSKLPVVSWPFTGAYWDGEKNGEKGKTDAWWPWEQKAYWIDGATRLAIVLQDEQLMAQVRTSIDSTLANADADGYLGPEFIKGNEPTANYHRWPQNVFFRSLAAIGDAKLVPDGSESVDIAQALQKHYLNDKASYGTPIRNVTNIEAMLWCYARTGDPRLLALAENSWQEYEKASPKEWADRDLDYGDLSPIRVFEDMPIDSHGVTYAEIMKLPAILYLHTGKEEYLKFANAAERRIFDYHILIDGIPSTSEWFRTTTALDSHETCDISDHTWSWGYMLMATGNSIWADRIERACYNAAPGAIKSDWKALQYFSCPNQFIATLNSNHNADYFGDREMAYQPNPGQHVACCGGNVHRVMPNYVIRMWMKTSGGGLAAILYGPSRVSVPVGDSSQIVHIEQTTDYPFKDRIELTIESEQPVAFPLLLRVPSWCTEPRLEVNGVPISEEQNSKGFLVLYRTFKSKDKIILTLPMKLAVTRWPQNGIGIERGPLVYSMPITANWTSRVEPRYTTEKFPSWEATPASDWNFGLALNPAKLESEVAVKYDSGPVEDPWTNPPITLTVPMRRINGWKLQVNPDQPSQMFTPPLPDLNVNKPSQAMERVVLVPYGATQLRMTIFPNVTS